MRIAYIVDGMWNSAGMERVISMKVNALCGEFDITMITREQEGRKPHFPLDPRIRMIDIGAKTKREYRQKLTPVLMRERFDICVSTGGLEFFFLYKIKDGSKKLFEFHFSYDISRVWIGETLHGWRLTLLATLQTWRRVWIAHHYDRIVALCQTDYKKWHRWCSQVSYIYNPLTIAPATMSPCTAKRVIAVGRLHYQKGFDMLIDAWKQVYARHPDWKLDIYGDGTLRSDLQQQIDGSGLHDVVTLCGRTDDIIQAYLSGSIFVLSSRDEAFGLVITEAEACGLPVVTFDCPSAPAELVEEGKNGYVVPLGDKTAMADRLCRLIDDEPLRQRCGQASTAIAQRFHIDNIAKQWAETFNGLAAKN